MTLELRQPANSIPMWMVWAICLVWLLAGLTGHDPWKPDEAYRFGPIYSMLAHGEWLVPTLAGEPFLDIAPGYYYVSALIAKALAVWLPLHDGARLASGLFMALTLIFTGLAGRELWGRGRGRIAALLLLGSIGLLVRAHQILPATALLAGIAIALYGMALARRRVVPGGMAIGIGSGLAFLASGLVELAALVVISTSLFLLPAWRSKSFAVSLAIALLFALPFVVIWPAALWERDPALFALWLEASLGLNLAVAAYYLELLPWFAWPALPLALWALWRARRDVKWRPGVQLAGIAFVCLFVVLLFRRPSDAAATVLLIPLALLGTIGVETLRRGAASALDWFGVMTFAFFALLLWSGWVAMFTGYPTGIARWLDRQAPDFVAVFDASGFMIALLLTILWLASIRVLKRSNQRAVIRWASGVTLIWVIAAALWFPWLDYAKSYRSMTSAMSLALPSDAPCVASRGLGEPQRALLEYFMGLRTQRMEIGRGEACPVLLMQTTQRSELAALPGWREIWRGNRPGERYERFVLYLRETADTATRN